MSAIATAAILALIEDEAKFRETVDDLITECLGDILADERVDQPLRK